MIRHSLKPKYILFVNKKHILNYLHNFLELDSHLLV